MPATIDEHGHASVTCDHCGKPITHTDVYGTYCDDECGRDDDIAAFNAVKGIFGNMGMTLPNHLLPSNDE